VTHPAQKHVDATRKRQKAFIEGRARGGSINRPGRKFGGAAEKSDGQSTVDNEPGPAERHEHNSEMFSSYAKGGGIHIKPSHKGMLHRELGVPQGEKIPAAKMEAAKAHASPAERKRITFAENARKWNH